MIQRKNDKNARTDFASNESWTRSGKIVHDEGRLERLIFASYDKWTLKPFPDPPSLQGVESTRYGPIYFRWWILMDPRGVDAMAVSTHSRQKQTLELLIDFEHGLKENKFHEIAGRAVRHCVGRYWFDCLSLRAIDWIDRMELTDSSKEALKQAMCIAAKRFAEEKKQNPAEIPRNSPTAKQYIQFVLNSLSGIGGKPSASREGV